MPLAGLAISTALLAGPAISAAPLPGMTISAASLPGMTISAAPLPETTISAVPLPEGIIEIAPLVGSDDTPVPLLTTAAPLVEGQAQTAQLEDPAPETALQLKASDTVVMELRAVVKPARPEDFWAQEEGASRPLTIEVKAPTPSEVDPTPMAEVLPTDAHIVGLAPLAVPETTDLSPTGSPQCPGGAEGVIATSVSSPVKPRTGCPSVAEVLQQRVISEWVMTTTTEMEETILQQPSEPKVEPMVISGGNTPVAPDEEEIDAEEEQILMMDETCL